MKIYERIREVRKESNESQVKAAEAADFMLWLYANYIRPQLDAAEQGDYRFHFDLVRNDLTPSTWPSLEKCLEFTAVQAFALGLLGRVPPVHSSRRAYTILQSAVPSLSSFRLGSSPDKQSE